MNMQVTYRVWIEGRKEPFEVDATANNLKKPILNEDGSLVFEDYNGNEDWRFVKYEVLQQLVETW
jgi:hypothetical protein